MARSSIADLLLRLEVADGVIKCVLGGPDSCHLAEGASSPELLKYLIDDPAAGLSTQSMAEAHNFGRLVAKAAFPEPIASEISNQLRQGSVRLGLDVALELAAVPWEYAYLDEDGIGSIALHPGLRVYRASPPTAVKSSPTDTNLPEGLLSCNHDGLCVEVSRLAHSGQAWRSTQQGERGGIFELGGQHALSQIAAAEWQFL